MTNRTPPFSAAEHRLCLNLGRYVVQESLAKNVKKTFVAVTLENEVAEVIILLTEDKIRRTQAAPSPEQLCWKQEIQIEVFDIRPVVLR